MPWSLGLALPRRLPAQAGLASHLARCIARRGHRVVGSQAEAFTESSGPAAGYGEMGFEFCRRTRRKRMVSDQRNGGLGVAGAAWSMTMARWPSS